MISFQVFYMPTFLKWSLKIFITWNIWTIDFILIVLSRLIGLVGRVFANGPGSRGSILGWLIQKTQWLDTFLLKTQHYKVLIKSRVEESRGRSSVPPQRPGVVLYTHLPYHNDSIIIKTDAHRKRHEETQEGWRMIKTDARLL